MNSYSIRLRNETGRGNLYCLASACLVVGAAQGTATDLAGVWAPNEQTNYHVALPNSTLNSQQLVVVTTAEAELSALANRSPLGRRLLDLRRKVLATGVQPLDWDGVRTEVESDRNNA